MTAILVGYDTPRLNGSDMISPPPLSPSVEFVPFHLSVSIYPSYPMSPVLSHRGAGDRYFVAFPRARQVAAPQAFLREAPRPLLARRKSASRTLVSSLGQTVNGEAGGHEGQRGGQGNGDQEEQTKRREQACSFQRHRMTQPTSTV